MCILNPVSTFLDKTCRLHEVKDERHAEAFFNRISLAKEDALPLGERVAALTNQQQASRSVNKVKSGPGGSREISFVSRSSAKYKEDEEEDKEERRVKRRGMQSLGLKADRSGPRDLEAEEEEEEVVVEEAEEEEGFAAEAGIEFSVES